MSYKKLISLFYIVCFALLVSGCDSDSDTSPAQAPGAQGGSGTPGKDVTIVTESTPVLVDLNKYKVDLPETELILLNTEYTPIDLSFREIEITSDVATIHKVMMFEHSELYARAVFFHEGYKTKLLDTLCQRLGFGKGIDLTYVNQHKELTNGLVVNQEGKLVFGFDIRDELEKNYGSLMLTVLNGFTCQVKK